MIIDLHAHLGSYAFRHLPQQSAPEFLQLMDAHGIDRAVVCSTSSLLYRDVHRGNEELYQSMNGQSRFFGVATINPNYAGWQRDLEQAVEEWGFKAVRLLPHYHAYNLSDDSAQRALSWCARRGVPVMLPQRIEDRRQRHLWDISSDLTWNDVAPGLRAQEDLQVLLTNWGDIVAGDVIEAGLQGRVLIDFARLDSILFPDLPALLEQLGSSAIAFGSHAPFNYYGTALLRLELIQASQSELEQIAGGNAARFLKLGPAVV